MDLITTLVLPSIVSVGIVAVPGLIALGKYKASTVTKKECSENQKGCNKLVIESIDKLKDLVIMLHDKQSKKIEIMDYKREVAKETTNEQMVELNKTIGKIEGHIEYMSKERE